MREEADISTSFILHHHNIPFVERSTASWIPANHIRRARAGARDFLLCNCVRLQWIYFGLPRAGHLSTPDSSVTPGLPLPTRPSIIIVVVSLPSSSSLCLKVRLTTSVPSAIDTYSNVQHAVKHRLSPSLITGLDIGLCQRRAAGLA